MDWPAVWRPALGSATDQCWIQVYVCVSPGGLLVVCRSVPAWVTGVFRAITSVILFLALGGCSELKDRDVASRLAHDRGSFEQVAKMATSKPLSCSEGSDHALECTDPEALPLFAAINKRDGVRSVQTESGEPRVASGVYFVMTTYGLITTNSWSKGLLYATANPSPVVADTDKHEDVPRRYNALYGNWYVFAIP